MSRTALPYEHEIDPRLESNAAYQEGLQDGRNAAQYEKGRYEPYRPPQPLTLEHARQYSDSYGCIRTQADVDAYNAAFSLAYQTHKLRN